MPFLLGTIVAGLLFACESETPPQPEPELIIKNQNPPLDIKGKINYAQEVEIWRPDSLDKYIDWNKAIKNRFIIKETGRVGINQPWGSNPADTLIFK